MRLDDLVRTSGVTATIDGDAGVEVTSFVHDSRAVTPGALFACVRGATTDGHLFAPDAVARGAVALVVERPVRAGVTEVRVPDVRAALGPLAAAFWSRPSDTVRVIGVTGTNGKTTTTHLLAAILDRHGWRTAVIGTLSGARTTPEAPELQAQLAAYRDEGYQAVTMEVSSHALVQGRVEGTRFAAAVFTNLGRDHLDFHGTVERYFAAKAMLFEPERSSRAVICVDDPHGRLLADTARIPTTRFSIADAHDLELDTHGSRFVWRGIELTVPLPGRFNVMNALAAATTAAELGVPTDVIAAGLAGAPAVPGRFETVVRGQPFSVLVDYAHTPDAVAAAVEAARELTMTGRVIVVVGAGGDRDPGKRPLMGEAAGQAGLVVVTSDNPRSEDPAAIIEAVRAGIPSTTPTVVEPDRRGAIRAALAAAEPGDAVLVVGKGHETTQAIGAEVVPFHDPTVVAEELAELGLGR